MQDGETPTTVRVTRAALAAPVAVALALSAVIALAAPAGVPSERGPDFDHDAYFERFDEARSADDHVALAQWCHERGAPDLAELHVDAALRHDTDHAEARRLAGYVEYSGPVPDARRRRWLTESELASVRERERELELEAARVAEARSSDPFLRGVDEILEKIRGDDYLADAGLVPCEDYRPYLLLVERGTEFHFGQIGRLLTAFEDWFEESFGSRFELAPLEGPLVVIAWRDRDGYDSYCEHLEGQRPLRSRAAHYSTISRQIVCHGWDSLRGNPYRPVIESGIFTHEATHQIVHAHVARTAGVGRGVSRVHWFQEGLAELCGNLRITPTSRKTGASRFLFAERAPHRAAELRRALGPDGPPRFSLAELMSIRASDELHAVAKQKSRDRWQEIVSLFYAQSWAFVYFLKNQAPEGESWERFLDVMRNELAGRSDVNEARTLLGIEDPEALEQEWLRWFNENF